jgi:hypothetical protein
MIWFTWKFWKMKTELIWLILLHRISMTQWIVNIKVRWTKIKSMLDLKMMILTCRNSIICTIQTIKEGNRILTKRTMDKKTLMKMGRTSRMKMMNMVRKKTRIWMNMVRMIWIIKWSMEMKMMKMIYLNQKKYISNMMIWKREEKLNRLILSTSKRMQQLHQQKKNNKICKYLQIKICKTKLKKIKTLHSQLICKRNILSLSNSSLNKKRKNWKR